MERRKILNNICEYPYQIGSKEERESMEGNPAYLSGPPDFIIKKQRGGGVHGTQQPFYKKRGYTSDSNQGQGYRPNRT